MYNKFNELINDYDTDNDEKRMDWYEWECKNCIKILHQFNDDEWKMLINSLPSRSNIVKERLLYCLMNPNSLNCKKVVQEIIQTDDMELFINAIYTSCTAKFVFSEEITNEILRKINKYLPLAKSYEIDAFNRYLNIIKKYEFNEQKFNTK